jgi:hypothetical protein
MTQHHHHHHHCHCYHYYYYYYYYINANAGGLVQPVSQIDTPVVKPGILPAASPAAPTHWQQIVSAGGKDDWGPIFGIVLATACFLHRRPQRWVLIVLLPRLV